MKFFKKLFHNTLTYKFYNCFATLVQYIKDYNIVAESLYSEAFSKVLLRYLNKDFKKDWIGRLYAIINPNIDINGKLKFLTRRSVEGKQFWIDRDASKKDCYLLNFVKVNKHFVIHLFCQKTIRLFLMI